MLSSGTKLGPYEIQAAIGAGGMGEVYRARDTRLDRTVAIKVLPAHIASDPQLRERFDREARTISQLNNPHICALYDVGENFLVLEYLQGQTLAERLKHGALPLTEALDVAIQIADALSEAHGHAIVHRDLKPANVMSIGSADQPLVKLLDFGLAKPSSVSQATTVGSAFATDAALTTDGAILGTFQYMAPEQLQGQPATAGTDVWAFGCVLHEMLAGRDVRVRGRIKPRTLNRLIDRCLAIDPADRPRAADLANGLRAIRRRVVWRGPIVKAGVVAAAMVLVVVGIVAAARLLRIGALVPSKPVVVLIADFENQTSEALFDGTVEQTIGLALEDSRLVVMYPRRDAAQTAALIQSGARLDERMSRLVAQREGVDLVLAGVVAPDRGGYVISAHLLDPRPGVIAATATERIVDRSKALEAIGRLGQTLRRGLGERATSTLPTDETFTTSSLDAAREYVLAQDLRTSGRGQEAAGHYEKALAYDPLMGRAYAGLAVIDHELGRDDDASAHMAKALELLPRMNRREQLRTQGIKAQLLDGDYRRAVEVYETLQREYPGDPVGLNNLAVARFMLLDFQAAKTSGSDLVRLFPTKHLYRSNLALYGMYAGDFETAVRETRNSIAMNPNNGEQYLPLAIAAAYQGNLTEARRAYDAMAKGDARAQRLAVTCLADFLIYIGDFRQARSMLTSGIASDVAARSTASAARRNLMLAEIALLEGDTDGAIAAATRATTFAKTPQVLFGAAMMLIDVGRVKEAKSFINAFPQQLQGPDLWYRVVADTALAVQRGDASAVARLEWQLEKERGTWLAHFYAGRLRVRTGSVATAAQHFAWCIQHRPEGAAAYLDDVATIRYWADAWYWSGVANEAAGDARGASASYESFLSQRPDAHDVRTEEVRRRLQKLSASGR
jgi:tetratricopeptide (TPR) repeat protein